MLSAQTTDVNVNRVTEKLFVKYRKPEDYLAVPVEELEQDIFQTGFYRQKTKSIRGAMRMLIEEFDGQVPRTIPELLRLPGVARKTANVVAAELGDAQGIVVDTHVRRISQRLALTREEDPVKIERDLVKIVPKADWHRFPHLADLARPARLRRAQAALRGVRDRGSVPVEPAALSGSPLKPPCLRKATGFARSLRQGHDFSRNVRPTTSGCLPEGDTLRAESVTFCPQGMAVRAMAGRRGRPCRRQPAPGSSRSPGLRPHPVLQPQPVAVGELAQERVARRGDDRARCGDRTVRRVGDDRDPATRSTDVADQRQVRRVVRDDRPGARPARRRPSRCRPARAPPPRRARASPGRAAAGADRPPSPRMTPAATRGPPRRGRAPATEAAPPPPRRARVPARTGRARP